MDPLSIAASACGIAAVCGTIVFNVSRFVVGVRAQDQSLAEFTAGITALQGVLSHVESVVSKRPKQLPFAQKQERKHWQDIKNVLEACNRCLYKLNQELPEVPDEGNHRVMQQTRIQLNLIIKSNLFVEIRGHISSYTQILQLSLTTMSLGSMWDAQQSQDIVRSQIQKLTSEIRATNALLLRTRPETEPGPGDELSLEEVLVTRNIEAWRESAESLAAAVTLYEPDQQSVADREEERTGAWADMPPTAEQDNNDDEGSERDEPQRSMGEYDRSVSQPDSGIEVEDTASDWDPEPENTYCLSVDILQCQITANQKNVTRLVNSGLYFQAEQYQRKGIELQDQLLRTHKVPFPSKMDAEETLADILTKQRGTKDGMSRAKDILQRLLQQEVKRDLGPDEDTSRRWRLYHKLSAIYLEFGFVLKAKEFATRALEGRKRLEPMPKSLVLETATLLIKTCQLNQDFDEAEGLRRWIHETELRMLGTGQTDQSEGPMPDPAMADVLRWCKDRGFDVDSPSFHFEQRNAEGKTPLHVAVSDEKLEIVEQIVDHVKTLETQDNDLATALLLACATRNRRTTEVLLKKGARVDVHDKHRKTPLHRVQNAKGGIVVARLLLDYPGHAINIDQKDSYDKTPLHLACEMGNEAMVDFLVDKGADMNCRGPAGCTPLHAAIYARRIPLVKKLLDRGADIAIRDSSGHDAMGAAKTANAVSPEIKRFIHEHEHRRPNDRLRRLSHASASAGDESSGRRRVSLNSASEYARRDTAATLVDSMEPLARVPTASSMQRKETLVSRASFASGGSSPDHVSFPPEVDATKTSKMSKIQLRWPKKDKKG